MARELDPGRPCAAAQTSHTGTRCRHASAATMLAGALVAGCAQIAGHADPAVAQLDRYQRWRDAGRWEAIAAEPPVADCAAGAAAAGCARVDAIYGEANAQLAFAARAPQAFCPPPAANDRLQAAAASLGRSVATADPGLAPAAADRLRALRVHALYCRAENAATNDEAAALLAQVQAESARLAAPAAPAFWRALVRLFESRPGAGDSAGRCRAANEAARSAAEAAAAGADAAQQAVLARVQHDAEQMRRSLVGCAG